MADDVSETIACIMERLRPVPDTERFRNGYGFVQQDREAVRDVKLAIYSAAYESIGWGDEWVNRDIDRVDPRTHSIGSILEDLKSPYAEPWRRLGRIDKQGREWGDEHYTWLPDHGEAFEV